MFGTGIGLDGSDTMLQCMRALRRDELLRLDAFVEGGHFSSLLRGGKKSLQLVRVTPQT